MGSNRVQPPELYYQNFAKIQEDDGSFWTDFRVDATEAYPRDATEKKGTKRNAYWSFYKKDEEGNQVLKENGKPDRWSVNWTMWNEQCAKHGDMLARLFEPQVGKWSARTRVYMKAEDLEQIYGAEINGKIYLKVDPEGFDVWVRRPGWNSMSQEQQMLWESIGNPEWLNMYTCEGGDPFASGQEVEPVGEEVKEPVAVGAAGSRIEEEEYLDL